MALSDHKIPIIAGRNDSPTTSPTQLKHPNGAFITRNINNLIDNELIPLKTSVTNLTTELTPLQASITALTLDLDQLSEEMLTVAQVRSSISVTGNGSYNSETGIIHITPDPDSVPPSPLNEFLYIDTNAPVNGTGTDVSPFNNVSSLVAKLNNSILIGTFPSVVFQSNVNLGDFVINSVISTQKQIGDDYAGYLTFLSSDDQISRNVIFKTIKSNIPLKFDSTLKVLGSGKKAIFNSEIKAQDFTGNVELVNSTLEVNNLHNSIVSLYKSNLTLLDGQVNDSLIESVQSAVVAKGMTTPASIGGIDHFFIKGQQSSIAIIDSVINNDRSLFEIILNSEARIIDTTFNQVSLEGFAKVLCDDSCLYYQKNCTGFTTGEPYNSILKIINGVVI